MRYNTVVAVALSLAAATAVAAPAAQSQTLPGVHDKSRIVAGTYQVDGNHTMILWEVDHFGFANFTGVLPGISGKLVMDPTDMDQSKLEVTIPLSRVFTVNPALTAHLLRPAKEGASADFFGANPADAKFVSTSVTFDDSGYNAKVVGNLTLKGKTRPLTLDAELHGVGINPFNNKLTVGFEASGTIRRSEFGVSHATSMVSDDVELTIHASFEKE